MKFSTLPNTDCTPQPVVGPPEMYVFTVVETLALLHQHGGTRVSTQDKPTTGQNTQTLEWQQRRGQYAIQVALCQKIKCHKMFSFKWQDFFLPIPECLIVSLVDHYHYYSLVRGKINLRFSK